PPIDDSWSDEEEDELLDVETAVQLGIPDGPLDSSADLSDPTVSRLGGHPTFLSAPPPPIIHATCPNCSNIMQLLIQIWCPMEQSPNDRALFVWACPFSSCQRKQGSVRAWRELRYNDKYAQKLEKKLAQQKEKEARARAAADAAAKRVQPKTNPFALAAAPTSNPFGLGSQIFGSSDPQSSPAEPEASETDSAYRNGSPDEASSESEDEVDQGEEEADALAAAIQATSLDDSPWKAAPAYSPLYLSTVSEYLPPPPKVKLPAGVTVDLDDDKVSKDKDGGGWAKEGYENSMDVDHAFERFSKRVSYEGEQCLRYELGGTPLPFSSDKVFDSLFPVPPVPPLPVTKPDFMVTPPRKRTYALDSLPPCPHCRSRRVFECQLMPNLINVLQPTRGQETGKGKTLTDDERRAEVLRTLKGQSTSGRGMEWGTCMIFSCEKDCGANDGETESSWREEHVLVQWDE
ncbi:programmed cell death protein 2, partial [Daedaleopsis nitida]